MNRLTHLCLALALFLLPVSSLFAAEQLHERLAPLEGFLGPIGIMVVGTGT